MQDSLVQLQYCVFMGRAGLQPSWPCLGDPLLTALDIKTLTWNMLCMEAIIARSLQVPGCEQGQPPIPYYDN